MTAKILVVEDDDLTLEAYKEGLMLRGYEVIAAKNGKMGLEKAISEMPDIILTDRGMPVMNGYEMTQKLKLNQLTSQIPVIGCGAFCEEEQDLLYFSVEKGTPKSVQLLYQKIEEALIKRQRIK